LESAGDAQGAALAYARSVKFGSQVKRCGGCHDQEGPKTMAWFRGWWAGRKYAEYAEKAGLADQALREQQEALARNPGDVNAQMLLAYLYEANGQRVQSEALWAQIAPANGARTASTR